MNLQALQSSTITKVDDYLKNYFSQAFAQKNVGQERLQQSIDYSLFTGGKRFRPLMATAIATACGEDMDLVIPWACSVEMIHTYSLIHDDLPCMDDDDMRRGQPTNHKKFDEATALLAGDALLTESFLSLSLAYKNEPEKAHLLTALLAQASGVRGMIGGQITDLQAQKSSLTLEKLEIMHAQKTGALIQVAAQGAALLCEASDTKIEAAMELGKNLGLAFQIADDILDYEPNAPELGSYPGILGLEKTKKYLDEVTNKALQNAEAFGSGGKILSELIQYNVKRNI